MGGASSPERVRWQLQWQFRSGSSGGTRLQRSRVDPAPENCGELPSFYVKHRKTTDMEPRTRKYPRLAGQMARCDQQEVSPSQGNQQEVTSNCSRSANKPSIQIRENTHTQAEPEESEGTEFEEVFQKLQEDIMKLLHTRKNNAKLKVNESFKNIQKKMDYILKLQHDRRKKVYQKHAREFANFMVTTTTDMDQIKREAEKLATQFQEQQRTFQKYVTAYNKKIASMGIFFQNHFATLLDLESTHEAEISHEHVSFKENIASL
ncbi:uncharacterized protein RHO17_003844 [Thomomys bottae]